jgi:hypothetical protein
MCMGVRVRVRVCLWLCLCLREIVYMFDIQICMPAPKRESVCVCERERDFGSARERVITYLRSCVWSIRSAASYFGRSRKRILKICLKQRERGARRCVYVCVCSWVRARACVHVCV